MTENILIGDVKTGKTKSNKPMFIVEYDGDKRTFLFKENMARQLLSAKGKMVEVEFTQAGKYKNLVRIITELEEDSSEMSEYTPTSGFKGGGKADPGKLKSIERQSALKQAVYLASNGHIGLDDIEEWTEKFYVILTK